MTDLPVIRDTLPSDVAELRRVAAERLAALTEQQRAFAVALATHGSATRAAREAGYSEASAKDLARRLKRHPAVTAAVRALAQLRGAEASYGPDELRRLLEGALDVSPEAFLVRNEAGDLVGVRDFDSLSPSERLRVKRLDARIRKSAQGNRAHVVSVDVELVSGLEIVDRLARLGGYYADAALVNVNTLGPAVIAPPPPLDPVLAEVADALLDDDELREFVSGDDATRRRLLLDAAARVRMALPERVA